MPSGKRFSLVAAATSLSVMRSAARSAAKRPPCPSNTAKSEQSDGSPGGDSCATCASSMPVRQPCMVARPNSRPLPLPSSVFLSVIGVARKLPMTAEVALGAPCDSPLEFVALVKKTDPERRTPADLQLTRYLSTFDTSVINIS